MKFLGVALSTMLDSNYSVNFKTMNDTYISLNSSEAYQLCMTVKNYVQDCYTNESILLNQINSASNLTELDQIDINIGWPLNN